MQGLTQQKVYMNTGSRRDRVSTFYIINTSHTHCTGLCTHCVSLCGNNRKSVFTIVPNKDLYSLSADLRGTYTEY